MTITKVVAAFCGAFLVLLLGKWMAEALYHVESPEVAAYVIEVESTDSAAQEVVEVNFDELLAAADVAKGAKVFKKCSACHKLEDGVNSTGPYLSGIVGRGIASATGFGFSGAMAEKGGEWTVDALDAFLAKPKEFVPGTSMSFSGLKKQGDRVNVIAYLNSLDD